MEDERTVSLTLTEMQFLHDSLVRRRMYAPTDCPLGNPYRSWMEATITKLQPYVKHHD